MDEVSYNGKVFEIFITKDDIKAMVSRIADEINEVYQQLEEDIVLISILDGSFIFMADLVRHLNFDHQIHFVKLSSYSDTESTGEVVTILDVDKDLEGKHVIVVEDIVDTGLTIEKFYEMLKSRQPLSIRICSLLSKPEVHNDIVPIDFIGKEISPAFVIGYGLDLNGLGRNLEHIYQLKL